MVEQLVLTHAFPLYSDFVRLEGPEAGYKWPPIPLLSGQMFNISLRIVEGGVFLSVQNTEALRYALSRILNQMLSILPM